MYVSTNVIPPICETEATSVTYSMPLSVKSNGGGLANEKELVVRIVANLFS